MKKALITGICGQDGSYLAELLLSKGYGVYGIERRVAIEDIDNRYSRIKHIKNKIKLYSGDIRDYARMFEIINEVQPDELYHFAAQSFVGTSFKNEQTILQGNIGGTINILNALRKLKPNCKFYHASSSEQFGAVKKTPQNEDTPFNPCSPYGIGKCASFQWTKLYREAYDMFCCNGILFNHESPRRGFEFVTRKITRAVANISLGKQQKLELGNLNAKRDWGFAGDYVKAMWLMLQQDKPKDYVVATNETHSIREFLDAAFSYVKISHWQDYVEVNKDFYRPMDVNLLQGNYSKAKEILGWQPKINLSQLIKMMVDNDIKQLTNE